MFVSCLPKARKLNNRTLSDKADMTGRVCSCNDIINLADGRTLRGVIVLSVVSSTPAFKRHNLVFHWNYSQVISH